MKLNFRNVVLLSVGAGYLLMHAPHTFAKPPKAAPSKQKVTTPKKKKKAPPAPTPTTLVADMRKSVAFMAKSSKSGISTKSKTARPYWAALKSCNEAVDQIEVGIRSKDDRMLKGLNSMGRSISQLSTSWGVLRKSHDNLEVGRGLIALSNSYNVYNSNYGPVAARKRQGGRVSEQELSRLNKCRGDTRQFRSHLVAMKSKSSTGSQVLRFVADLLYLCDQLDRFSGNDLDAYCGYCDQFDRLHYSMYGYGNVVQAWYPTYASQWNTVSTSYTSISTSFTYQSWSSYESWDYTSQSARNCDGYYETTAAVSDISSEDIKSYSSYTRDYSEESAVEVSSEELTAINAEVSLDEEESGTFAEEVGMGEDDKDADGISDEKDADDDNDGSKDSEDKDDDGDGIADAEESKEVPDATAEAEEDSEEEASAEEDSEEEMTEEEGDEEPAEEEAAEEESAEEESAEEEPAEEEMTEEEPAEEESAEEEPAEEEPAEEEAEPEAADEEMAEEEPAAEEPAEEEPAQEEPAEEESGGGDEGGGDDSGGGEEE